MEDQKPDQTAPPEDKKASALAELSTPIYGLFTLGILYTLYLAHQIILPIILAILTSLLLAPLVKKARLNFGVPRVVSALVLVLLVLAGVVGLGLAVASPALEWAVRAPQGMSRVLVNDGEIRRQLDKITHSAEQVEKSVEGLADDGADKPA